MSSLKSLSENRPSPPSATIKLQGESVGDLDALPNEIKVAILDCLLPHEQLGFARTGALGLELSNQSVAPLVPFPARVTSSRALEWTRQFKSLPLGMQKTFETTSKYLPLPDIFSPIPSDVEYRHLVLSLSLDPNVVRAAVERSGLPPALLFASSDLRNNPHVVQLAMLTHV